MDTPLSASATSAGNLFSGTMFMVPPYQREYAWGDEEVTDFWSDLRNALDDSEYFLGLVILTEDGPRKHVVDGQQRLLTITLFAASIFHEANKIGRRALADRIQAAFLTSIDYGTDAQMPRLSLTDEADELTLRRIVASGKAQMPDGMQSESLSDKIIEAYQSLTKSLQDDLGADPFKRLGQWADFLTNRVYLAAFVHPDPASAYRVFEVINTRGKELTTADLLKNYVLSQTPQGDRDDRYARWQGLAGPLNQSGPTSLVNFIRHVVILHAGYVLPRDLFDHVAGRTRGNRTRTVGAISVDVLMERLNANLPLYMQMIDPSLEGPAEPGWLGVFAALNELGVTAVRPLLLAIAEAPDASEGMRHVLKLVLRRIVVGNLGTGNTERRLSEAARRVGTEGAWRNALAILEDLNPPVEEFINRLSSRSFNKGTLGFMRRSQIQRTPTPAPLGVLHLIRPRQSSDWTEFPLDEFAFWGSTIGNTVISELDRRPKGAGTWPGFQENLLPQCSDPDGALLKRQERWTASDVKARSERLAAECAEIWYGEGE